MPKEIYCDRCSQEATEKLGLNNFCFPCLQDVLKLKNEKPVKFLNLKSKESNEVSKCTGQA